MRQHSSALERKWNRQLTRPIFPVGAKKMWSGNETMTYPGTELCLLRTTHK